MKRAEIEARFQSIQVWRRGEERAPHKPLLLLYALGHYSRGGEREIPYSRIDEDLRELLIEFGPTRSSVHPEYPFWHLQSDGLWELTNSTDLQPRTGGSNPPRSQLLASDVHGGFPEPIFWAALTDPHLFADLAHDLLDAHFPASIHDDILSAVGLDLGVVRKRRRSRDPAFRGLVLTAYEHQCAVCGFELRLGGHGLGIEAAHIMWHQAGGPDTVQNGLALCVLHHKLFDRGVFTFSEDRVVQVSELAHGGNHFKDYLLQFHGGFLRNPQSPRYLPKPGYVDWHRREVFRGQPRDAPASIA
jgi:putative restriction endonuclease